MKGKYLLPVLLAMMATTACLQDPEAPMNQPELPTLAVDETSLTRVSMVVNGTLGKNMEDVTGIGVEISETLFEDGGTYKSYEPQEVSASGFSLGVTDLTFNSTYFLRAYITNGYSRLYSSTITQKTPESSVASISDVTIKDNYYLVATIEDNGGRSVEDVGFLWSTSSERKDIKREKRYVGTLSADGKTFTLPLSEVGEGTHYILAYAEDDKDGTGYSRIPFEYSLKGEDEAQIEDPNFKKYLLLYHDANEDGKFTYAELKQVEFIDVHTDNIKSVREIDQMPLKSLSVNGTQAQSGQLTSLNVSRNTALLSIDCSNNNLKELDASMIPGLEYLNCEGNPMETLYLSYYQKFNELLYPEGCRIVYVDKPDEPIQEGSVIRYTSLDGNPMELDFTNAFDVPVISNTKENGECVITFQGTVTTMYRNPFAQTPLVSIIFPETLQTFEDGFYGCDELESIQLPSHLKTVPGHFLVAHNNLRSLEFPETDRIAENWANGPISICKNLETLTGPYATSDHKALIKDGKMFAFAGAGIKSYSVPSGVTSLGGEVFRSFDIEFVELPSSLTSIGYMCFAYTLIPSIEIPESVTMLGENAFTGCGSLISIHIPEGADIGEQLLDGCTSLEYLSGHYATDDGRCLIKDNNLYAFAPAGLEEYTIPEGVQRILSGLTWLWGVEAITLPQSLSDIYILTSTYLKRLTCLAQTPPSISAQFELTNIEAIYVPEASVEAYKSANGWSNYADRIQPIKEEDPNSIIYYTSLDGNVVDPYKPDAFNTTVISNTYEDGIGKLVFDGPLTKIGYSAFFNSPLLEVTIPDTVEDIAVDAFWQEPAHWTLQAFYGKGASENHLSLVSNGTLVAVARKDEMLDFVIPEDVTKVGWGVFSYCKYKTVTLPSGLQSCEYGFPSMSELEAFYGPNVSDDHRCVILNGVIVAFAAKGLTSYTLTYPLEGIGGHAFYNQYCSLEELVLPDSATSVGTCAFSLTPITSLTLPSHLKSIDTEAFFAMYSLPRITIPAEVESIGSKAFSYAGNKNGGLTDITFLPETPPVIKEDTFVNLIGDGPFYVPAKSVQAYKTAQYWSAYADRIQAIPATSASGGNEGTGEEAWN